MLYQQCLCCKITRQSMPGGSDWSVQRRDETWSLVRGHVARSGAQQKGFATLSLATGPPDQLGNPASSSLRRGRA